MIRISIEIFERNKNLMAPDDDCAMWQVVSRGADRFAKGRPVAATVTGSAWPIAYHSFAREYVEGCIVVQRPSTRRFRRRASRAKAKITNTVNIDGAFRRQSRSIRAPRPLMPPISDGNIRETHLGN